MRTARSLAVALLMTLVAGVFGAAPARAADGFVQSSDPSPHQELKQVPGWVTIVFKATASTSLATIVVLDSSGANVATGPMIVEGTNVTTQLRSGLPKGTYTVYYRTTDEFGERRGGSFQFAYGKGNWTPLESEVWKGESAQPTILNDTKESPSATPTESETPEPTEAPSPAGTPTPTVSPSATTQPATTPDSGAGWLIGGGVAVVLLAGGAWLVWWLRRRG